MADTALTTNARISLAERVELGIREPSEVGRAADRVQELGHMAPCEGRVPRSTGGAGKFEPATQRYPLKRRVFHAGGVVRALRW